MLVKEMLDYNIHIGADCFCVWKEGRGACGHVGREHDVHFKPSLFLHARVQSFWWIQPGSDCVALTACLWQHSTIIPENSPVSEGYPCISQLTQICNDFCVVGPTEVTAAVCKMQSIIFNVSVYFLIIYFVYFP